MSRGTPHVLIAFIVLAGVLTGCRFGLDQRDPWRAEAEEQCLAAKAVVASPFMEPLSAIDGPGSCGMEHPFRVSAFAQGNVVLEPAGRLACPVIYQVDMWVQDVVQPAALAWLGQPVVAISQMSSYSCRGMNGDPSAKISEHAFGNALDVGGFRTADGRWITVKNGWKGSAEERGFLLQVQAGACERFTTVLAPGSNMFHYDHIHVDLMRHAKGRTICKPAPRPLPAPPMAEPMPSKAPPMGPPVAEAAPVYAPPPQPAAARPEQPSFFSTLFGGPRPAPQPVSVEAEPPPPLPPVLPPVQAARPMDTQIVASPAPPPPAYPASSYPPSQVPASNYPPAAVGAPGRQPLPPQGLPPGWQVGPQGVPMSYSSTSNPETGSIKRKYYTAPIPQPSTIPLPKARAGDD